MTFLLLALSWSGFYVVVYLWGDFLTPLLLRAAHRLHDRDRFRLFEKGTFDEAH